MLPQAKLVAQWGLDGTLISTFPSVKEAAEKIKRSPSSITHAIRNNGNCSGYLWSFSIDYCPDYNKRKEYHPSHVRDNSANLSVSQYSKDGLFICNYSSITEAALSTGINKGDICSCCKGQKGNGVIKHTAGGYIWKYTNMEKQM